MNRTAYGDKLTIWHAAKMCTIFPKRGVQKWGTTAWPKRDTMTWALETRERRILQLALNHLTMVKHVQRFVLGNYRTAETSPPTSHLPAPTSHLPPPTSHLTHARTRRHTHRACIIHNCPIILSLGQCNQLICLLNVIPVMPVFE